MKNSDWEIGKAGEPDESGRYAAELCLQLSDGRDFGFSSLSPDSWVYSRILRSALQRGDTLSSELFDTQWTSYQKYLSGLSVAQMLGLSANSSLSRLPYWCVSHPWALIGPRAMKKWLPPRVRKARRKRQIRTPFWARGRVLMDLEASQSGQRNYQQFADLIESVSTRGFSLEVNAKDPLLVDVLEDGSESVWSLHSGFHRTATLSALGHTYLYAGRRLVVKRENVSTWPQVVSGDFSESEALQVFDSFLEARLLPWMKDVRSMLDS